MKATIYILLLAFLGWIPFSPIAAKCEQDVYSLEEIIEEIDIDFPCQITDGNDLIYLKSNRRFPTKVSISDSLFKSFLQKITPAQAIDKIHASYSNKQQIALWEHDAIAHQHLFQLF